MTAGAQPAAPRTVASPPPLLVGATLLLWGSGAGTLPLAVLVAALYEGSRLSGHRWALAGPDWVRLFDLTIVIVVVALAWFVLNEDGQWVWRLIQLLPLLGLPVPLAQRWSREGVCQVRDLSQPSAGGGDARWRAVDTGYGYGVVCLAAALSHPQPAVTGLAAVTVVAAWMLWSLRPRAWRRRWFVAGTLVACGLTAALALGVESAMPELERWAMQLLLEWGRNDPVSAMSGTTMGRVGTLRLSDRIVLWLEGTGVPPGGLRLRLASYRLFSKNTWYAGLDDIQDAAVEPARAGWRLHAPDTVTAMTAPVTLTAWLDPERAVLPLPEGTAAIWGLPARKLRVGRLGTVTAEGAPALARFQTVAAAGGGFDRPPDDTDLLIPDDERPAVMAVAATLGLSGLPPSAALARVERHFAGGFRYSLTQEAAGGQTALAHFLSVSHRGHCEFFATATVLLLRAAGVPARYETGYVATERDPWSGVYRVRGRHAHAWTQAFIEGAWRTVDTTPAGWAGTEAATTPIWQAVPDLFSWLSYRYALWRHGAYGVAPTTILSWLLIPGFLFLGWRVIAGLRQPRPAWSDRRRSTSAEAIRAAGAFDPIERHLASRGWVRSPWQPLLAWLQQLPAVSVTDRDGLLALAHRHYQATFKPEVLTDAEAQALTDDVARWLGAQNR